MRDVYLCRHGETEWTISGQHTGITEISLTERGAAQATALGARLQGIHFQTVISSPRVRALETCRLAGFDLSGVTIDPDAQEWNYGTYEGRARSAIIEEQPGWNVFLNGAPGGESPEQVQLRADRLLHKISHLPGPILIFSHGHFSRVLAARWLNLPAQAGRFFYLTVAAMNILGFEREQPVIKLWNSVDLC